MRFEAQRVGMVVQNTGKAVRASLRMAPTMPKTMQAVQAHQPQQFEHDKTPLLGGGCYRFTKGVLKHRASRLGRECSGLMAVREGLGALFLLSCAAHGQNGGTRTRQVRPSLAGQGVALGWCCFACCSV